MYETTNGTLTFHSVEHAAQAAGIALAKLPYTLKIIIESLLRNVQTLNMSDDECIRLLQRIAAREAIDIPILPTRVIMQDASGVPALVDLVTLREQLARDGVDPATVNPVIPVALVIDHSVQVDTFGHADAFAENVAQEYARNEERYTFLKWAQQAFQNVAIVPPANGIIHQVNIEYLTHVVATNDRGIAHPELVIGTDSHTTMVNALGVLGWGVGGIEAEAAMMGVATSMTLPKVVGVKLIGELQTGVTATDIALTITETLRQANVVGKFVEYFGDVHALSVPDRATIANMAPEYGATCGFFPVDDATLAFLRLTGKDDDTVARVKAYCQTQHLLYDATTEPTYEQVITIDLRQIEPSVAGPKRPQDRLALSAVKQQFEQTNKEVIVRGETLTDGSVVIAAITSCTNTSNPYNMIAAGLLAMRAVEQGLTVNKTIQTSLAPGSKVVTSYLTKARLLPYLEQLGFYITGYGCSVCVGNTGELAQDISEAITNESLSVAAVLSGNRNFEGRIHRLVKSNYLASPPLVIAYALAGTMHIDLTSEPIAYNATGQAIYLRDLWPTNDEVEAVIAETVTRTLFTEAYNGVLQGDAAWQALPYEATQTFTWNPQSTYFKPSPFFEHDTSTQQIDNARVLLKLGDSITTDHISPVGHIEEHSATGHYLKQIGVAYEHFNSYGARRGNFEALVRGTFAHPRLQNALSTEQGGYTRHMPSNEQLTVYDAAQRYRETNTPLIVLAGKEYGTGSARDWAAKGTYLLGVKAVIAESFERIHRSNLAMMGIIPLQFEHGESAQTYALTGEETFTIVLPDTLQPKQTVQAEIIRPNGDALTIDLRLRLDTQLEIDLYKQRGIFQAIYAARKQHALNY